MNHSRDTILDDVQDQVTLTSEVRNHMQRTAKWTKFLGVFVLILSAIGVIGGSLGILGFLMVDDPEIWLALFLIIPGGLGLYLGNLLRQYSNQLRRVSEEAAADAMSLFLQKQRDFWRVLGILVVLSLVAYGCFIGFLVLFYRV